jgi:hypothetical protein
MISLRLTNPTLHQLRYRLVLKAKKIISKNIAFLEYHTQAVKISTPRYQQQKQKLIFLLKKVGGRGWEVTSLQKIRLWPYGKCLMESINHGLYGSVASFGYPPQLCALVD